MAFPHYDKELTDEVNVALLEANKNRENIIKAIQWKIKGEGFEAITTEQVILFGIGFILSAVFPVKQFKLSRAFGTAIFDEILNWGIGAITGGINTAYGGEGLPSWKFKKCCDPNYLETKDTWNFPFRQIFVGKTFAHCIPKIRKILLCNPQSALGSHQTWLLWKQIFQKGFLTKEEYIISLSNVILTWYPLPSNATKEEIKKHKKMAYKVALGGPMLHMIFKNQKVADICREEKFITPKKYNIKREILNYAYKKIFKELYGVFNYKDNELYYKPKLNVKPEDEPYKYMIYEDEKKSEKSNPFMDHINKMDKNNKVYGVRLALSFLLLYNVCAINFQLYIRDKLTWESYINNCFELYHDVQYASEEKLRIANYIPVDLFKSEFPNYPVEDLFKLSYEYVAKNWKYIIQNMHQTISALNFYFPKKERFLIINLTKEAVIDLGLEIETEKEKKLKLARKKELEKRMWSYLVPTLILLLASIIMIFKIYKKKNRR